ncbi:MAG: 2OG-Fe(II) oxygenase [Rhodospirillales bacterium]
MTTLPPIDFKRYPLDKGREAVADIVDRCRTQLDRDQFCSLPGFFLPDAVVSAAAEAESLIDCANAAASERNCYLQRKGTSSLPPDHPRNIMNPARYRMIAADLFPATSALKRLYFWPPFQEMIAEIVGEERLFPSEDPLQPVNVICYSEGDQSAWHYDSTNAFTMTLMLQAADDGGLFELAPNTRKGENDEDIPYMQEVLRGERHRVKTVSREAGELTIFRGCNSLHRVSPVHGTRKRLMAVFVYETEPGIVGDPEVNMTVYGRTGLEAQPAE